MWQVFEKSYRNNIKQTSDKFSKLSEVQTYNQLEKIILDSLNDIELLINNHDPILK